MLDSIYQPISTEEVPLPIVEAPERGEPILAPLPRALAQAAGRRRASRRVLLLAVVFVLVSLAEAALLLRLGDASPVVVYRDLRSTPLVEEGKR